MIRVCYVCNRIFGEKEPLEDRSETHGVCDGCLSEGMERINQEMEEHRVAWKSRTMGEGR